MDFSLFFIILFYLSIILVVYFNRDRFTIVAKIIALYRTHAGLSSMSWLAKKMPRAIKAAGYFGIIIGILGMFYISYVIVEGFVNLLINPNAPAVITPVIPGIKIPGAPLFVPFWYGIISIFIVAAIHEFSHGVVSAAHKIKVKNSGIVFFGPIIGAFVEPDEDELKRAPLKTQLSVFCAGPFSNIVTGAIALLMLAYVLVPFAVSIVQPDGIYIQEVVSGYPADNAGIKPGTILRYINGEEVRYDSNFTDYAQKQKAGAEFVLSDGKNDYKIKTVPNPDNETLSYIGLTHSQNILFKKSITKYIGSYAPWVFFYFIDFLKWFFILGVGIGLANLLPLGPADGGRIVQLSLFTFFENKRAAKVWQAVTLTFIFLLVFNLLFPYARYIF